MDTGIFMYSEDDFRKWMREELINAGVGEDAEASDKEERLTRDEVAKLLKISKQSVDNYRKQGILRWHSVGGNVMFFKTDVYEDVRKNLRRG